MELVEVIVVMILILAILVLIYYYFQNNPEQARKIRTFVSDAADSPMEKILHVDEDKISIEGDEGNSMTKKIKVKFSDIDFNTDGFSKKIDAFLDEKSDQLIKDWDLATTKDLSSLEEKFTKTVKSVDDLESRLKKFQSETDERFEVIEKRIEELEK